MTKRMSRDELARRIDQIFVNSAIKSLKIESPEDPAKTILGDYKVLEELKKLSKESGFTLSSIKKYCRLLIKQRSKETEIEQIMRVACTKF